MAPPTVRFAVANQDRTLRAASWRCWANSSDDRNVYVACRELDGNFHLSLHESRQWHVAIAAERFDTLFEDSNKPPSRFMGKWEQPPSTTGLTIACRIFTPCNAVTVPNALLRKDIVWIESAPQGSMNEVCVVLAARQVPVVDLAEREGYALVGAFDIGGGDAVSLVCRTVALHRPTLPERMPVRFFRGKGKESLVDGRARLLWWQPLADGAIGFFEGTVRMQPVKPSSAHSPDEG